MVWPCAAPIVPAIALASTTFNSFLRCMVPPLRKTHVPVRRAGARHRDRHAVNAAVLKTAEIKGAQPGATERARRKIADQLRRHLGIPGVRKRAAREVGLDAVDECG